MTRKLWPTRGWGIADTGTGHLYFPDALWTTRGEAEEVLDDLLAPYPEGHAWRQRLSVLFSLTPGIKRGRKR